MSEGKKHDGPYSLQESNSSAFCEVVGHDGKVAYPIYQRGMAEHIRDRLNSAYHAGRADLLKQLGAGDWLPKVGDVVQVVGDDTPQKVERVEICVFDINTTVTRLARCKPYVCPLEVGETVRNVAGFDYELVAIRDGYGVLWCSKRKHATREPLEALKRVD